MTRVSRLRTVDVCRSISLDNRKSTEKYVERVRSLINTSMDRIGAAERERNDCLARWKLPECLDVCLHEPYTLCSPNPQRLRTIFFSGDGKL